MATNKKSLAFFVERADSIMSSTSNALIQLEHVAAVLEAVQLQVLAGDTRIAAQNLAKLRAILEHRAGRYALVRVDRQPCDLAAFRRGLATKAHWSKRDRLLPGGL